MAAKKKAPAKKAAPKPRTKKELGELAKKVVHAPQPKGRKLAHTEAQVLAKLQQLDKATPGMAPLDLVKKAYDEATAKAVFTLKAPAGQKKLELKAKTGGELTSELCNLEMRLSKERALLGEAIADKEAAAKKVKGCEADVQSTYDAIAECLRDLRTKQGRISFPAKKSGTKAA